MLGQVAVLKKQFLPYSIRKNKSQVDSSSKLKKKLLKEKIWNIYRKVGEGSKLARKLRSCHSHHKEKAHVFYYCIAISSH